MDKKKLEPILSSSEEGILGRLIHHVDKQILKYQQEFLTKINISQAQALFIIYLGYYSEQVTYQYMLEKSFGLTNPTVTASLKSLINKDIIYRERDEKDGRYYRLYLTDYGKTLVDSCADIFFRSNQYLTQKLTPEEINTLVQLLNKLK